jgi:hypothetical protein
MIEVNLDVSGHCFQGFSPVERNQRVINETCVLECQCRIDLIHHLKSPSTYQPPSEINEIKIAFEIRSPSQPIIKRKSN